MSDYLQHQRGQHGETIAVEFLERKGFAVVARNFRHRRNEVDLIVRQKNTLVFVEVKLRKNAAFGHPEAFVNEQQALRITEAAEHYVHQADWEGSIRFDIIAITLQPTLTIEHFEDAFY